MRVCLPGEGVLYVYLVRVCDVCLPGEGVFYLVRVCCMFTW